MKVISAHVKGYGRFVESKINLGSKVITILGPNKAGKTTLLKSPAQVDGEIDVPVPRRSRAIEVSDLPRVTTFGYIVENKDRAALADFDLDKEPTRAQVTRSTSGDMLVIYAVTQPEKSVQPFQDALATLKTAAVEETLDEWNEPNTTHFDPESDDPPGYGAELGPVIMALEAAVYRCSGKFMRQVRRCMCANSLTHLRTAPNRYLFAPNRAKEALL